jgi:hypothetical protein
MDGRLDGWKVAAENRNRTDIPSVAKERGFQRQGVKGEDVIFYFEPLITPHLKSSRFPNGLKNMTE